MAGWFVVKGSVACLATYPIPYRFYSTLTKEHKIRLEIDIN